jgi:hypothetical protein
LFSDVAPCSATYLAPCSLHPQGVRDLDIIGLS